MFFSIFQFLDFSTIVIFGVFLGYFYRRPTSRWLTSKKTRKQYRDALSFERGERIRLERELYETKKESVNLKDQLKKNSSEQTKKALAENEKKIKEIESEKERLEQSQDRLRSDLFRRKERIADLLTEIAIAQSDVAQAHTEIEELKRSMEPQRQNLKFASEDASLKEVLKGVTAIDGVHLALIADDFGLVVETSHPGPPSEKLAAVTSLIAREGEKIKDIYEIGNIETFALGDDRGFFVDNTYFHLFDLRCSLSIVRDKTKSYPDLAHQTVEAIVSRLQD